MVLDRLHLHTIGPAGRGMCLQLLLVRVNACLGVRQAGSVQELSTSCDYEVIK